MNKRIRKKHSGNFAYILEFISSEDESISLSAYTTLENLYDDLIRIIKMHESIGMYILPHDMPMDDYMEKHGGRWPAGRYRILHMKLDGSITTCPEFQEHFKIYSDEERNNRSSHDDDTWEFEW